jgi:hypothetical protein
MLFDVGVSASLDTRINCGRLDVDFNLSRVWDDVRRVPQQIVSNVGALTSSLPMLAICYSSPALCAELKNMHFNINERLKGLTDVCKSVNSYINDRATEGAAAQGVAICTQNRVASGWDTASATEYCKANPAPNTYMNIASAWTNRAFTTGPQDILKSILTASNQYVAGSLSERDYRFMSAMLGELTLNVNGQLLPVWPAHPMTAKALGEKLEAMAVLLACDQGRLDRARQGTLAVDYGLTPDQEYYQTILFDVAKFYVQEQHVRDLFILDPPDRDLACNALGRSFGKESLQMAAEDSRAKFNTAIQNPAVPAEIRQMYEARASAQFAAMLSLAKKKEHEIPALLQVISKMADTVRKERKIEANLVSKALDDQDREFATTPCESEETCQ